jgi:hypothetical protein
VTKRTAILKHKHFLKTDEDFDSTDSAPYTNAVADNQDQFINLPSDSPVHQVSGIQLVEEKRNFESCHLHLFQTSCRFQKKKIIE